MTHVNSRWNKCGFCERSTFYGKQKFHIDLENPTLNVVEIKFCSFLSFIIRSFVQFSRRFFLSSFIHSSFVCLSSCSIVFCDSFLAESEESVLKDLKSCKRFILDFVNISQEEKPGVKRFSSVS